MTLRECAIVQAYTGVDMVTGEHLDEYYKYISELFGRPVYTHELANEFIQDEIKRLSEIDFIELCLKATEE